MENKKHIIEIIDTLLKKLGVAVTEIKEEADEVTNSTRFVVVTPDSAILIGEHGARLLALNHLVKRMIEREKINESPMLSFSIDVNDYQKKRIEDVRSKAQMLAERARYFKSSVEMDPMSSYERMIVHALFTETKDIVTESTGGGRDRRVVIRYTENKAPAPKI